MSLRRRTAEIDSPMKRPRTNAGLLLAIRQGTQKPHADFTRLPQALGLDFGEMVGVGGASLEHLMPPSARVGLGTSQQLFCDDLRL